MFCISTFAASSKSTANASRWRSTIASVLCPGLTFAPFSTSTKAAEIKSLPPPPSTGKENVFFKVCDFFKCHQVYLFWESSRIWVLKYKLCSLRKTIHDFTAYFSRIRPFKYQTSSSTILQIRHYIKTINSDIKWIWRRWCNINEGV